MSQPRAAYRIKRPPVQRSSEHEQQATVIAWAKLRERDYPELEWLFAVPNGGKRAIKTALTLQAEGVKRGVPDLWLPVPRMGYHGLVIEMKWGRNIPTPEQARWIYALTMNGYRALVCYSAGEAITAIENYLRMELQA